MRISVDSEAYDREIGPHVTLAINQPREVVFVMLNLREAKQVARKITKEVLRIEKEMEKH